MSLSHTFVLNLKLERLCLAKKILEDCGSSTRPGVSPKEFPSTHSASATTFRTRHSMTGSDTEEGCTCRGGRYSGRVATGRQ